MAPGKEHDSERPHVRLSWTGAGRADFRCAVSCGAGHIVEELCGVTLFSGQPKVRHEDSLVNGRAAKEQVLQLDVAVDDAQTMAVDEGADGI